MRPRPDLRAETPRLEPDPVLLTQLTDLAARSVPSTSPVGAGWRLGAATVAASTLLAGGAWVAGAVPGAPSPVPAFQHEPAPAPSPSITHDPGTDRHGDPAAPEDDGSVGTSGRPREGSSPSDGPGRSADAPGHAEDAPGRGPASGNASGRPDGAGAEKGRDGARGLGQDRRNDDRGSSSGTGRSNGSDPSRGRAGRTPGHEHTHRRGETPAT